MSNNRSSNRRRGRGSNRSQGGNQLNRIDSRARGNAPQLLEKYKKLAHDAQLNGDRVQSEYYLQFADHYFRVLADSRAQKDDARGKRDSDRDQPDDEDSDLDDEAERGQRRGQGRRDNRERSDSGDGERGFEDGDSDDYDASDNPFTRENRGRPRRGRKDEGDDGDDDRGGFDPSVLPPAIGKGDEEAGAKPRKPRRSKPRGSDDEETLEAAK